MSQPPGPLADPDGLPEVTGQVLARVLGLSADHVARLARDGMPHTERNGQRVFALAEAVRWYVARTRQREGGRAEAELRYREAKARLAELEVAERERQLVPLAEVAEMLGPLLDDLRARLHNLPGRAATLFPDPREAAERLQPVVDEVLQSYQEYAEELVRRYGGR